MEDEFESNRKRMSGMTLGNQSDLIEDGNAREVDGDCESGESESSLTGKNRVVLNLDLVGILMRTCRILRGLRGLLHPLHSWVGVDETEWRNYLKKKKKW